MWPFSSNNQPKIREDYPPRYGLTDVDIGPDARHIDVAILYGLGQHNRAQHLARQLRPAKFHVGLSSDEEIDDETLRRVREKFKEDTDE